MSKKNKKSSKPAVEKQSKPGKSPAADSKPAVEKQSKSAPVVEIRTKGKLGQLLGHSVISVMRALGKHGADFKQISAVLKAHKIEAAERTIRGAIRRGKKGESKIADLPEKDIKALLKTAAAA